MLNYSPKASQFVIQESPVAGRYINKKLTYNDLLMYEGQYAKDYHDLSQAAKSFYASTSQTLSESKVGFQDWIMGMGGVEEVDSNEVRWKVYYKPERRFYNLGNPNSDQAYYGQGGWPFKIRLSVDWFKKFDILAPKRNKRFAVVVQSDPRGVSGKFEYDVVIFSNPDYQTAMPKEYLSKDGDEWVKLGMAASDKGSTHYSSIQVGYQWAWLQFATNMTTMQYEFAIEQEAHEKWGNLEIARCGTDDGKPDLGTRKITNFLEMEAKAQIDDEIDMMLYWGEQTKHMVDLKGNRITTSPGLAQYLAEANDNTYHPTSKGFKKVIDLISSSWFDRVPIPQRRAVFYTGEGGIEVFNQFIKDEFENSAVTVSYDFILGEAAPYEPGRKGYSFNNYQFTKYKLPTFGEITIVHWPLLDNTRVNGVNLPGTNKPASSFEFITFDWGFGKPNVRLLRRKSRDFSIIKPGMFSPLGYVGPDNPVFKQPGDSSFFGYHWLTRTSFGLVIMDPKRVLRFRPAIAGQA